MRPGLADFERTAVTARFGELVMTAVLDLTGFEWAGVRLLELEMLATRTRLNLSNFERAAARLRSGGLERMVVLAVFGQAAVAGLCELVMAAGLRSGGLEREAARPRPDGFEWAATELRGPCELAAIPNLGDLERAAAGLCELGTKTAARLNVVGVVRPGAVLVSCD